MHQQKIIQLLSHFSLQEIKAFQLFLHSDYFKIEKRPTCIRLLDNILQAAQRRKNPTKSAHYDFRAINKSSIALATFGKEGNPEKSLSVYTSFLYTAATKFVTQHFGNASNTLNAQLYYLDFLQQNNLNKLFDKHFKSLEKCIQTSPQSEALLLTKTQMAQLHINHLIKNANKRQSINTSNWVTANTNYQILSTLKIVCEQLNLGQTNALEYDNSFILPFVPILASKQANGFANPLIELYYLSYQCFLEKIEVASFFNKITQHHSDIVKEEVQKLSKYAKNICIESIQKSQAGAFELLHQINQFLVTQNLFTIDGQVSIRDFTNTIYVAARMKKFEWGHQFIAQYAPYLPDAQRQNNQEISQGLLFFENKEFEAALDILLSKHFDSDILLESNRRNLVIKAYYELGYYQQAEQQIDSFVRYLRSISKKKMPQARVNSYKLFLQELRKLVRLHYNINLSPSRHNEKLDKLLVFAQSKQLNNQAWLLEKIKEGKK